MLVRRQRDEESLKERTALREMANVWKDLKEVRQRQGYSNTAVRLVTHKEEADGEADRREWEAEMARELQEAREEHEAGMEEANARYEEELKQWKIMHSKATVNKGTLITLKRLKKLIGPTKGPPRRDSCEF